MDDRLPRREFARLASLGLAGAMAGCEALGRPGGTSDRTRSPTGGTATGTPTPAVAGHPIGSRVVDLADDPVVSWTPLADPG